MQRRGNGPPPAMHAMQSSLGRPEYSAGHIHPYIHTAKRRGRTQQREGISTEIPKRCLTRETLATSRYKAAESMSVRASQGPGGGGGMHAPPPRARPLRDLTPKTSKLDHKPKKKHNPRGTRDKTRNNGGALRVTQGNNVTNARLALTSTSRATSSSASSAVLSICGGGSDPDPDPSVSQPSPHFSATCSSMPAQSRRVYCTYLAITNAGGGGAQNKTGTK